MEKRILFAVIIALGLLPPPCFGIGGGVKANVQERGVPVTAAASTGICYQLTRCRKALDENKKVTAKECWDMGGNSWKPLDEAICVQNPNPE